MFNYLTEIFTKVELLEAVLDENLSEIDLDNGAFENDGNVEDKLPYQNNLSVEVEPPKKKQKLNTGRKRGRPRKSEQKITVSPSIKMESLSTAAENEPLNSVEVKFNQLEGEHNNLNGI